MTKPITESLMQPAMSDVPPLHIEVPDGFHPLPLGTSGEEREAAVSRLVRDIYPNGNDDLWNGVAPTFDGVTQTMVEAELTFAAMGLFDTGSGGVAQCAFTIAVAPSNHPTPEVAANGIREILLRTTSIEAQYIDLPCGPAVMGISIHEVTYDGNYTATGLDTAVRMGRLQAYVPFPTGPYLAVLTLETPAMEYWENFSIMMRTVLLGIRFPVDSKETANLMTQA